MPKSDRYTPHPDRYAAEAFLNAMADEEMEAIEAFRRSCRVSSKGNLWRDIDDGCGSIIRVCVFQQPDGRYGVSLAESGDVSYHSSFPTQAAAILVLLDALQEASIQ